MDTIKEVWGKQREHRAAMAKVTPAMNDWFRDTENMLKARILSLNVLTHECSKCGKANALQNPSVGVGVVYDCPQCGTKNAMALPKPPHTQAQ